MIVPRNYLNNRDLLKEIHKSKVSYCSFTSPEYSDYDFIITKLTDIPKLLKGGAKSEALKARIDRLTKLAIDAYAATGVKVKADEVVIDPNIIRPQDVIFRLKTWDHIPEAVIVPKIVKLSKKAAKLLEDNMDNIIVTEYDEELPEVAAPSPKYVKLNFPPFQHWKMDDNNEIICVGKSHWKGDLETGEYSRDHGQMTDTFALMCMKLCDRYATRGNWRGYSYLEEMKSAALLQLTQVGLQFDESVSNNPFSYMTMILQNSFTRVLNIEKRNQSIRDDILQMNDLAPSFTRQNMGSDDHGTGYSE
jgi:hypothetical protein